MKIKYLLLFLALPICFSCSDDLLNQEPTTSVSDEQIMTDVIAARTALMGAYAQLGDFRYHTLAMITSDVMGQDLTMTRSSRRRQPRSARRLIRTQQTRPSARYCNQDARCTLHRAFAF